MSSAKTADEARKAGEARKAEAARKVCFLDLVGLPSLLISP